MNDRTKQILIVTVGVVLLAGAYLLRDLFIPRPALEKVRCANGSTAYAANPDVFFLKYSGRSVVATAEWDKLKANVHVEDRALREADVAVQLLDSRLRDTAIHQAPLACDPKGAEMLVKLESYRADDFGRLVELAKELKRLSKEGTAADGAHATQVLGEAKKVSEAAETKLGATGPKS